MNTLAIVALVVAIVGFFSSTIVQFLPITSGIGVLVLIGLVALLGLCLGIAALRQIARTNEKGKVLAWLAIILVSLRLIGIGLILTLGFALSPRGSEAGTGDASISDAQQQAWLEEHNSNRQ